MELMNALPLLNEIQRALERLRVGGETRTINILNFPLPDDDSAWLDSVLGRGNLTVTYEGREHTFWQEAKVSGVWWGEYRNASGKVTLRTIEIAIFPQLAKAQPQDIDDGIRHLAKTIAAQSSVAQSSERRRPLPVLAVNGA